MSNLTTILTITQPTERAINWSISQLQDQGLQVERTFDLHSARLAHADCPCPHHGTEDCSCQMVVLFIHGNGHQPVTLIVHGNEVQTCLSLVESANQPDGPEVINYLLQGVENLKV